LDVSFTGIPGNILSFNRSDFKPACCLRLANGTPIIGWFTRFFISPPESPKLFDWFKLLIIDSILALSSALSPAFINTLPSLVIETMITFSSGAFFEETELGVCTVTAEEGFGLAVKIKKDNKI